MSGYKTVTSGTYKAQHTDHTDEITKLRQTAGILMTHTPPETATATQALIISGLHAAAALLEVHDDTGISLDNWTGPRELVESALLVAGLDPKAFLENHV